MLDYNTEFTVNTVDMNLAETCNYLQISTINAINEFQTTVLLSEYGYLLENGCEIDYDTDGNDIITEGVMDLFTKIKEWIKATYEKLVNWITDRIDDVRQWFSKVGLGEKKVEKCIKVYVKVVPWDLKYAPSFSGILVNCKKLESAFPVIFNYFKNQRTTLAKLKYTFLTKLTAVQVVENSAMIPPDHAKMAFENVYNTGNVVKSIRTSQAQAIKQIEDMIKTASSSNQLGEIENYKNSIKCINEATNELIKLYRDGIQSSIIILKKIVEYIQSLPNVARAYQQAENIDTYLKLTKVIDYAADIFALNHVYVTSRRRNPNDPTYIKRFAKDLTTTLGTKAAMDVAVNKGFKGLENRSSTYRRLKQGIGSFVQNATIPGRVFFNVR